MWWAELLNTVLGSLSSPVVAAQPSYESIASAVGTGSSGTITFSSIPSTYTHLQVRGIMRSAGVSSQAYVRLNGDSGNNYAWHYLYGEGNGPIASAAATTNVDLFGYVPASTDLTNTFTSFVVDIVDYASTTKYKTLKNTSGYDFNGSGQIWLNSAVWMNTAATTSVSIISNANFNTSTQVALYGIKGA
jgi:hypothetical protein